MTSGALVRMGHACMRVSEYGLGKAAMPCRAMWSVIVVTIEGVTDSRPYLRDRGNLFSDYSAIGDAPKRRGKMRHTSRSTGLYTPIGRESLICCDKRIVAAL